VFSGAEEAPASTGAPAVASTPAERHFVETVWPTFRDTCLECHGPRKQKSKLRFDDPAVVLGTPDIVIPGDPAASILVEALRRPADAEGRMPPATKGPPLAEEKIAAIERWIAEGAAWPAGALPGPSGAEDASERPERGGERGE
jgi:hypothetical protein